MRTCPNCSEPLPLDADSRRRYCSRKCSETVRAKAKRQGPWAKTCPTCETDFMAGKSKQVFCSYECRYPVMLANTKQKYADFRAANPLPEVYHFTCDLCLTEFTKDYIVRGVAIQRGIYCLDCRPVAQSMRYRLKTVKRQSQTVAVNRIAHEQLAERDGLICYLCNEPIDMTLARTSKYGATIDHVVPLSRGGLDELENLRLAHWVCNSKKSNKLVEELNG